MSYNAYGWRVRQMKETRTIRKAIITGLLGVMYLIASVLSFVEEGKISIGCVNLITGLLWIFMAYMWYKDYKDEKQTGKLTEPADEDESAK